ncbi:MAG: hypothetical protein Q9226_009340, partial [Calogaya cf. arnoldii]
DFHAKTIVQVLHHEGTVDTVDIYVHEFEVRQIAGYDEDLSVESPNAGEKILIQHFDALLPS